MASALGSQFQCERKILLGSLPFAKLKWLTQPVTKVGPAFPISELSPSPTPAPHVFWNDSLPISSQPFCSQAPSSPCKRSFEITILMDKNRRKKWTSLPREGEFSQYILNRNTLTFILKLPRTWKPSRSSFVPFTLHHLAHYSWTLRCASPGSSVLPSWVLRLFCALHSIEWVLSLQKIWHLFPSLCITGRIRKRENLLKKNPRQYIPVSDPNSLCGIKKALYFQRLWFHFLISPLLGAGRGEVGDRGEAEGPTQV